MGLIIFQRKKNAKKPEKSIKQLLGYMLKTQLDGIAEKHGIENPQAINKKNLIELLKDKVERHELKPKWWRSLVANPLFQFLAALASIVSLVWPLTVAALNYFEKSDAVKSNTELATILENDFQVLKDDFRTVQYRKDYIKVVDSRMPPNTQVFLKIGYSSRPMDIMQLDSFCNRLILNFYQDCHVDTVYGARIEVVRSRLGSGDIN